MSIYYRSGYKYQLAVTHVEQVALRHPMGITTEYITLTPDGKLEIKEGYAWDGPSGPTFDSPSSMRGSLVHDALYQLLREQLLPASDRELADRELYRICLEDGMWKWRAKLWLDGVRDFAGAAADPKNNKKVYVAP